MEQEAYEVRELRSCIRDLVALSAMSAWWIDRSPSAIAESLRDLLLSMLRPDAAHVELRDPQSGNPTISSVGTFQYGDDPEYQGLPRGLSRPLTPARPDSIASFRVGVHGQLGRIAVGWDRQEAPSELELLLLQVAANHVAVAFQQASLLTRHQEAEQLLATQASQQAAVARLEFRALTGIAIDRVIDEAVAVVHGTLGVDCCELLELSRDGESLSYKATAGWSTDVAGLASIAASPDTQAGYTLSMADPVIVQDLRTETRFIGSPLLCERGTISGLSVVVHDQVHPYGVLSAHSRSPRDFTASDVQFLQSVANLLAAALQQQRLEVEREGLLHQAQRAAAGRDRAMGVVSHDLGNPLSTIQICATALLDPEPPAVDGVRNMASIIQRSAGWMQQIVHDLLDRASLDSGRLTLDRHPTPVADVIGPAQVIFAPVALEQRISFSVDAAPGLPEIDVDSRRVQQVLSNLLSNAMKFTPAGGQVVLSVAPWDPTLAGSRQAAVRLAVRDSGPGIPAEDLPHIFDWFWHARRSGGGSGGGGTGLGLAIAKGLVEAHGASLEVESLPGRGTSFWFIVPVA
jgi:signal transduction histidine kinase